jgi:putative ABC transport system substrate-binding protein
MNALTRRSLLAASATSTLPRLARAAPKPRIVMLLWRGWEEACDGFRDYLHGRGIEPEYILRDAGQTTATIPGLVADIKRIKPDLVFIWGGSTALAALGRFDATETGQFLTDIPVVLAIVADPLGSGLVSNLDRPGRPVTGTIYVAPVDVQLHAIQAYRPFTKIATLYNPLEQSSSAAVKQLAALTGPEKFTLLQQSVPLVGGQPDGSGIPKLVADYKAAGAEWLYIPPDTFLNDVREALTQAALDNHLPAFSATERFVSYARGLAGLVCRYYNIGQFAGFKAEQILNGIPAGTIPIQTLSRFSLLIRMKTAQQLGFYPPISVLRYSEAV